MENKARLKEYLEYLNEDQINTLMFIVDIGNKPLSKHEIADFIKRSLPEENVLKNYDTATPVEYVRRVREIYPEFTNGNLVYDYTEQKFGQFINLNDMFFTAIYKNMKQW